MRDFPQRKSKSRAGWSFRGLKCTHANDHKAHTTWPSRNGQIMSAFFLVVFPHPPNIASGLGGHYYFLSNSFKLNLDLFTSICKRGCRSPRFPWNCTTFCFAFLIAANVRDFPRAAAFFFNCFRFDVAFVKSTISGLRENLNTKEVNTIHFIVLHPGLSDVVL